MKKGAIVISTNYGKDDSTYIRHYTDRGFSRKISQDTFTDFKYGPFKDSGITNFVDLETLNIIFQRFKTISLSRIKSEKLIPFEDNMESHSYYEYIGRKE